MNAQAPPPAAAIVIPQPRPMPHDIEVEQALLGACLTNAEAIDQAQKTMSADDFYDPLHARTFSTLVSMREAGQAITVTLLKSAFGADSDIKFGEGMTLGKYFGRLLSEATTVLNARDYALTLRRLSDRRRIITAAEEAIEAAAAPSVADTSVQIASAAISTLDTIMAAAADNHSPRVSLGQAARKSIEHVEAIQNRTKKPFGVTWGVRELNEATLGMSEGHLILICARTSMGKTTFAVSVAVKALLSKNGIYFVSLEMTARELADRALSSMAFMNAGEAVTYADIRKGNVSPEAKWRLQELTERLDRLPFVIEQESSLTVSQIKARARQAKARMEREGHTLNLIIVDHIALVRPSERYSGAKHNEIGEISAGLKAMAKEFNVPVMALCQLNRATEENADRRPTLANLNHSGSLEQDADIVIGLYREAYYLERKVNRTKEEDDRLGEVSQIMEALILKQRQGRLGMITMFASMPCNYISDLQK